MKNISKSILKQSNYNYKSFMRNLNLSNRFVIFSFKNNFSNIYIFNPPGWFKVVQETTGFLQDHLKKDETFLAIPYGQYVREMFDQYPE